MSQSSAILEKETLPCLGYKTKTYDSGLATYYYDFGDIENPFKKDKCYFDVPRYLGMLWNIIESFFDGFAVYQENADISIVFKRSNYKYVSHKLEIDWYAVVTEQKVLVTNIKPIIEKLKNLLKEWYLDQNNEFNTLEDLLYEPLMRQQLDKFLNYVISNFILGVFLGCRCKDDCCCNESSNDDDTKPKPFKFHMPYEYENHPLNCGQLPFLYQRKKSYTR